MKYCLMHVLSIARWMYPSPHGDEMKLELFRNISICKGVYPSPHGDEMKYSFFPFFLEHLCIRPRMGMRWNRNILCILDFINHYTDFTNLNNVIVGRISCHFYHQCINSLRESPVCAVFFTQRSGRFAQFVISIYLFWIPLHSINSSVCQRITDYFH